MEQEFSKIEKEIELQLNRLHDIEREYLQDKRHVHTTKLQLSNNVKSVEEGLTQINEQAKQLRQELFFLKKVTINAIKKLQHTSKVEDFNKLKRTIQQIDFPNKVTKRNIHKIIKDGFED